MGILYTQLASAAHDEVYVRARAPARSALFSSLARSLRIFARIPLSSSRLCVCVDTSIPCTQL